jgi:hypothetical protein
MDPLNCNSPPIPVATAFSVVINPQYFFASVLLISYETGVHLAIFRNVKRGLLNRGDQIPLTELVELVPITKPSSYGIDYTLKEDRDH